MLVWVKVCVHDIPYEIQPIVLDNYTQITKMFLIHGQLCIHRQNEPGNNEILFKLGLGVEL
jgi:hypothetical protein